MYAQSGEQNNQTKRRPARWNVRGHADRGRRKNRSDIKDIDKAILNLLEDERLTTKQISQELGFANCTILHHLEKLYEKGIINRTKNSIRFVWHN